MHCVRTAHDDLKLDPMIEIWTDQDVMKRDGCTRAYFEDEWNETMTGMMTNEDMNIDEHEHEHESSLLIPLQVLVRNPFELPLNRWIILQYHSLSLLSTRIAEPLSPHSQQ